MNRSSPCKLNRPQGFIYTESSLRESHWSVVDGRFRFRTCVVVGDVTTFYALFNVIILTYMVRTSQNAPSFTSSESTCICSLFPKRNRMLICGNQQPLCTCIHKLRWRKTFYSFFGRELDFINKIEIVIW